MFYLKLVIFVALAYFIGNISPATMISGLFGIDIKKEGSGNAGATNMLRVMGWKAALITLCIDILKGFVAVTIASHNCGNLGAELAFIAVVIGHVYPVLYKFKGGKGVATSFGAAIAVNWPSASAAFGIAAIAVGVTRKMSVGSIAAAIAYPILIWFYYPEFLPAAIIMGVMIIFTHRENIKRLKEGNESEIRLGGKPIRELKNNTDNNDNDESKNTDNEKKSKTVMSADEYMTLFNKKSADKADEKKAAAADDISFEKMINEPIDYYADEEKNGSAGIKSRRIAVIGNGSFGTAIANVIAHNGHSVWLWGRNREAIEKIRNTRVNEKKLPGAILSDSIKYTSKMKIAVKGSDIIVFAVPAQHFREVAEKAARYIDSKSIIVNLAKGIEEGTLKLMSEIAAEVLPNCKYVALSGPSHAEEIVRNCPTTVVAASKNKNAAKDVQNVFMGNRFRVYTAEDTIGVQLGGALKNVIAIGTGIADGMNFGDNTKAAIMTRGIHEISRLGEKLGADKQTFAGLSGIGDLMVTCSSNLSRNRRFGILIGEGFDCERALKEVGSTVEGYYTVNAAKELADREKIEMPITDAVYALIHGEIQPEKVVSLLMERDKKEEVE